MLYLRHRPSGSPFGLSDAILLLTNPLSLKSHLDNWSAAGLAVEEYELVALLSDEAFNDFMRWADERDLFVVIDAVLDPVERRLASGAVVKSMGRFEREYRETSPIES